MFKDIKQNICTFVRSVLCIYIYVLFSLTVFVLWLQFLVHFSGVTDIFGIKYIILLLAFYVTFLYSIFLLFLVFFFFKIILLALPLTG